VYEGVQHLLHPGPVENPTANYVVLAFAMVFEGLAWTFAWEEFSKVKGSYSYIEAVHRGKDPSMFVVLFEDSAAMLGLIVAFFGVFLGHLTGNPFYDGAASVLIGLILGGTAIWLAYETKGLLIGEGANEEVVEAICDIIRDHEAIRGINEIATLHMGPEYILVNLSVDFVDSATADDVESTVTQLTHRLRGRLPRVKRVFIEAEAGRGEALRG
jgi:divalent metal cation (Fe/Co/Zn/Cd) transporter